MSKSALCLATLFLLSACGGNTAKEVLGLDTRAPDEFRVVARPPLSVPPQFDLRPPGAEGVTSSGTRDKAQSLVLGGNAESIGNSVMPGNAAENRFLQRAGAAQANPNVKQELAEKRVNEQLQKEDEGWWSKLTYKPDSKEPVVKAEGEAERIRKNKEAGNPVTTGETPETGGGVMSTIEHWFGSF